MKQTDQVDGARFRKYAFQGTTLCVYMCGFARVSAKRSYISALCQTTRGNGHTSVSRTVNLISLLKLN